MTSLGIHIEKQNSVNKVIYLIILNIFWGLSLMLTYITAPSNSLLIITLSCLLFHTICSFAGIEASFLHPRNLLFHLIGSMVILFLVAYIVNYFY